MTTSVREEIKTFLIGLDWDAKPDYIVDEILKIFENLVDSLDVWGEDGEGIADNPEGCHVEDGWEHCKYKMKEKLRK